MHTCGKSTQKYHTCKDAHTHSIYMYAYKHRKELSHAHTHSRTKTFMYTEKYTDTSTETHTRAHTPTVLFFVADDSTNGIPNLAARAFPSSEETTLRREKMRVPSKCRQHCPFLEHRGEGCTPTTPHVKKTMERVLSSFCMCVRAGGKR